MNILHQGICVIILTMPQNRAPPEEIVVCVVEPSPTGVERGRKKKSTPSTRCPCPSDIYFKSLNMPFSDSKMWTCIFHDQVLAKIQRYKNQECPFEAKNKDKILLSAKNVLCFKNIERIYQGTRMETASLNGNVNKIFLKHYH